MFNRIAKLSSAVSLDEASTISAALSSIMKQPQSAWHDDDDYHIDDGYHDDYEAFGNLSGLRSPVCDGCFCHAPCPNDNDPILLRRIIRWVKIIARSKHGMTVVCSVLPLMFGLLLGFYLGRRWEKHQKEKKSTTIQVNGQDQPLASRWVLVVVMRAWQWVQSWATTILLMPLLSVTWKLRQRFEGNTKTIVTTPAVIQSTGENPTVTIISDQEREEQSKLRMLKDPSRYRQSGIDLKSIPKHIAFIMDGNRRYGKSKYKSVSLGHRDGGYKLRDMVHWCLEECVKEITVYAFSTENWNRSPAEIDALMSIFCQQCEDLRRESKNLGLVVRVLSTDTDPIPAHVKEKLRQLEEDTKDCRGNLFLNVCLSYGSRGEMVGVCRSIAEACVDGSLDAKDINEEQVESRLLTRRSPPPDILLRTSGEVRISNFLLWQCAYSEFYFLSKHWPDLDKEDLMEVLRNYAGRKRRFGK